MSIIIDTPLRNISRKITSRFIGYGSVDVEFPNDWYIKDSSGEFILDDKGNKIFGGSPTAGVHGIGGYISPYQLDSSGEIVLDNQQEPFPYYRTPIIDTNWRALLVDGIATPLDTLEAEIQYVTIQAKFTNLGRIWVGNSFVTSERGIYLDPNHPPINLNVLDLRKIYIIGNAGEGVTFLYGTNEDLFLTTPGGDFVTTPGGEQIDV